MKPTSFRLDQTTLDDLESVRGWLQRRSTKRVAQADALAWALDRVVSMLPELERQEAEAAAKPPVAAEPEPEKLSATDFAKDNEQARERRDALAKQAALAEARKPKPDPWRLRYDGPGDP